MLSKIFSMIYIDLIKSNTEEYKKFKKKYNLIGSIRLFVVILLLVSIYLFFNFDSTVYIFSGLFFLISFVVLLIIHEKVKFEKEIKQTLIAINEDEIAYLKGEAIRFNDGNEFIDPIHFYTFDLDIFGKKSLFQNVNRTATFLGKQKLAHLFQNKLSNENIQLNQEAVSELTSNIEWRQYFFALAKLTQDSKEKYEDLINWSKQEFAKLPKIIDLLSYIIPSLFILAALCSFFDSTYNYTQICTFLFFINLSLAFSQLKKIKNEILYSDKILQPIKQYALMIATIESQNFESTKLKSLRCQLINETSIASKSVKDLASIVSNMHSVQNVLGAILINGVFLYHIHILKKLYNWKKNNSNQVEKWLEVIGEIEVLNSVANFSYNNSDFVFPKINEIHQLNFKDLGHPLIPSKKRICNDIIFQKSDFIILTGSNMSGKSTFLRTLGINMVLAGIGAPICASSANLHPLHVIVSMRQSDSLSDGESYFFTEVKRLKQIMEKLGDEYCFVLLDEILKGTNSDDKQTGTIEVIKKLISKNATGCIATHDLEVCQMTKHYQNILFNKCFEVEIKNNDLHFDYTLREGICKNKSATFLMEKMEII